MTKIVDKDFGILYGVDDFNGNFYWSGKTIFKNYDVDISFVSIEENPSIRQREFLKSIDKKYDEIVTSIYPVLPNKLKEDKQLSEKDYFLDNFRPKAILISKSEEDLVRWSITFQSLKSVKHFLSINFIGLKPIKSLLEK